MFTTVLTTAFIASVAAGVAATITAAACGRRHRLERESEVKAQAGGPEEYALALIRTELVRAQTKYGPMRSPHEGHSIIMEECRELESEVFVKHSKRDEDALREEAVQLGAMSARFIIDVVEGGKTRL